MIPYVNKLSHATPVRRIHVVTTVALPLLFAVSWLLLGLLLTIKLLSLTLIFALGGFWVFLVRRVIRALRSKEVVTIHGPVALRNRPNLFMFYLLVQVLTPLALIGAVIHVMKILGIQLFNWA